jgi:hypothetical protein
MYRRIGKGRGLDVAVVAGHRTIARQVGIKKQFLAQFKARFGNGVVVERIRRLRKIVGNLKLVTVDGWINDYSKIYLSEAVV